MYIYTHAGLYAIHVRAKSSERNTYGRTQKQSGTHFNSLRKLESFHQFQGLVCNSVYRHAVSTASFLIPTRCRRCIPFRLEVGTLGGKEKGKVFFFLNAHTLI